MALSTAYKYPLNIDADDTVAEYKHRITFTVLRNRQGTDIPTSSGSVTLYMPGEALKTTYGQSYGDAELGALGNLVSGMNTEGAQAVQAQLRAGSLSGVKAALDSALGGGVGDRVTTALKESTAKAVKDKMSGGMFAGATTALQNVLGQVRNPHKAIVYSGPGGFRSFQYTFVMTPESPAEAKEIADIVYFFKYYMHPGMQGVAGSDAVIGNTHQDAQPATMGSSTFTYPNEFNIALYANRKKVDTPTTNKKPALFKINKCFIENLTTDFTTSGQPAFFQGTGDGVPVTTTLGLTFKETVLVTRESIAKGF
jgi:hypothetical protein